MKKKCIVGLGSPFYHDDGIGIYLLEKLKSYANEELIHYDFIDGGTGGLTLLHIMNKYDLIILLDAVKFNESAGVLRIFTPDEVKSLKPDQNFSTHNQDFFQIIEIAKRLKQNHTHFFIAGIQPADLSFGEGLSKELINRMDIIENKLLETLINL